MKQTHWIALVVVFVCAGVLAQEDAGQGLARKVASAAGSQAFAKVTSVHLGWRHEPKQMTRTYTWDVPAAKVRCETPDGGEVEVPLAGWAKDAPSEQARNLHRAWVNDGFWAMSALHLAWDKGISCEDLGEQPVPQLPKLGKRRALAVRYGKHGGYTPGDLYVFYLGEKDLPVAWAFHRGGAKEPSLVTTWEGYVTKGGLTLPTRFNTPDGKTVIRIVDLEVESSEAKPASQPASRPAGR